MIAPARLAAYQILSTLSSRRSDLPTAIARARESLRDERDKALAAEIATGVQRQRAALDYLIAHFAKRPLGRLDPEVLDILRLSAYQLLHLSRVPAAAVVDDAVKLTGKVGKRSASGLVNAVLRALSRNRASLPLPSRPATVLIVSAPRLFEHHALASAMAGCALAIGSGCIALTSGCSSTIEQAPLTLRANTVRASVSDVQQHLAKEDVVTRRGRFAPDALIVDEGHPLRGPDATAGFFVVQDEALSS
jgi:16S rRNA (cytosine967-C5)-methyltransferase